MCAWVESSQSAATPLVKPKRKAKKKPKKKSWVEEKETKAPGNLLEDVPSLDEKIEKIVKERVNKRIKKNNDKKGSTMSKTCVTHSIPHFPKDPACDMCIRSNPQKSRCQISRTKRCEALPLPETFGDVVALDHKVMKEDDAGRDGDRNAIVIFWDGTPRRIRAYDDESSSAKATIKAMQKFLAPNIFQICAHSYSDNSEGITAACGHSMLSTEKWSSRNAVRRVKEGTGCTLSPDAWWKEATECFCFLENVEDILWTHKTSYTMRFGRNFRGPYPYGSRLSLFPVVAEGQSKSASVVRYMVNLFICRI